MTDVIDDFNNLYTSLVDNYNFRFYLNCNNKEVNECTIEYLQERRSYFCCAVDSLGRCVLHKCILIIFGTWLDGKFRANDKNKTKDFDGTFMIDGRNLSFPNIMMNNNILIHNFYDKLYSKSCKRMFLYGNVDEEKKINRAIQLVYDKHDDVLFARDVYARDYVVTEDLNAILDTYLRKSGKWEPLNFLFDYKSKQSQQLVEQIKQIMRVDINYSIDSLANKIIYKHEYLLDLIYKPILKTYKSTYDVENVETTSKKRKLQSVLYLRESKKILESIVNGKLIYVVSKTFSKQRKNFINYQDNSSNNNIEINPPILKYRIGSEVVRITNDTMRQDMLMQKSDFKKFVDSFFHGEMTVAGKKFFLCRNVRLPSVNYMIIAAKFKNLIEIGLLTLFTDDVNILPDGDCCNDEILQVVFNDRPTIYCCLKRDLYKIFYELKRNWCPIEIKIANRFLFINHHEGMVCLRRTVVISHNNVKINVLLTPYEYHNSMSLLNTYGDQIGHIEENDNVTCLMSKLVQYYYKGFTRIFSTIPVPKLIVSLTNLKNAMPVVDYCGSNSGVNFETFLDTLPFGNSVVVTPAIRQNNKMCKLWTLVRDNKLMTAEDPYIPDIKLPIRLYNNKVNKLKGKLIYNKNETPVVKFTSSSNNNCVEVEGGNILHMSGVVVSNVKIGWVYDGKRYKIETCRNQNFYLYKIYIYFRQIENQKLDRLTASMVIFNDIVHLKLTMIVSTNDLQGIKICGIHGQKGVMNGSEDLTEWMSEDGTSAQICLSPISYLSRQSNFDDVEVKYVVRGGNFADINAKRYPIYHIPYMFFNNTPDNIFKEFIKMNYTGHEKVEGTRLDQWTINQSFAGNRWAESLQCIRGSSNLPDNSGEYNVILSLLHSNNTIVKN